MARHRWPRRPRLVVRTGICSPPRHASSVAHGAPPPLAARRTNPSISCLSSRRVPSRHVIRRLSSSGCVCNPRAECRAFNRVSCLPASTVVALADREPWCEYAVPSYIFYLHETAFTHSKLTTSPERDMPTTATHGPAMCSACSPHTVICNVVALL